VLLAQEKAPDEAESGTRVRNVLCDNDIVGEKKVAELGFPVLAMLSESPAVVNCIRYVLEVSWKDILDEFVPLTDSSDAIVTGLHVDAASQIVSWRDKCAAKLQKLKTCHGQSAFSLEYVQAEKDAGLEKHNETCPFVLAPELMSIASIMYGPCLLSMNFDNTMVLCDPHLCLANRKIPLIESDTVIVLRNEDVGINQDGEYTAVCQVFNPLAMLSLMHDDDTGVTDLPDLSETFVRSLVAPSDSAAQGSVNSQHYAVRYSGLLGTRTGFDFLFPSHTSGDERNSDIPDNRASSQCFEAISYWPQHWQAPFGEILHDTHEHVSAFGNYMALLTPDVDCGDTASCQDRLVLLPEHLRFENMSSNFFGTSGICREHSFGMPMVHTNTHAVCTSNLRSRTTSENSATPAEPIDSFICEAGNTETCSCSNTPRVGIGGGMGDTVGHLWPLLRAFLEEDDAHLSHNTFNTTRLSHMTMEELTHYVNLDINIDLQNTDSIDEVVRERCYSSQVYANDETFLQQQGNCMYDRDCVDDGQVCDAMGTCVDLQLDVLNNLRSGSIEVGLNSPSCDQNQDSFSGASPWRRMHDILEQHGMCSHANRVGYERMNDLFDNVSPSETGCTSRRDNASNLEYWVCDRSMVNWTWVRERPDFIPFPAETSPAERIYDMRTQHISHSILHDELFDIAPHLCDSEYMHSQTLGWCGLQHSQSQGVSQEREQNARWMRNAPQHSQFSMLKPPAEDIAERSLKKSNAPRDKLRFMGMHREMLQYNADTSASVRQNLAIQKCGDLGVCQTEIFSAAGSHRNRKKPVQNVVPTIPPATEVAGMTVKVGDMLACGPMGYLFEPPPTALPVQAADVVCVLDRAVVPIVYWLDEIARSLIARTVSNALPAKSTACRDLFGSTNWNAVGKLSYDAASHDLRYRGGRRDDNTAMQIFLNAFILMQAVPRDMDRVLASNNIHQCALDLAVYIENQPTLYAKPRRETGLYVILDFGTYEIPIFWWLKYSLSAVVFEIAAVQEVTGARLNSETPLLIDAFERRISPQDVTSGGRDLDGITLQQFWSRINAEEHGLLARAHDVVISGLANYLDTNMSVAAIMGCVEEFTVSPHKMKVQRDIANAAQNLKSSASQNMQQRNREAENMLDTVFTVHGDTALWGGSESSEDGNVVMNKNGLSCVNQFSETDLLRNRNGLDSILTFHTDKFRQVNVADGFMQSFLKRTFDVSIPVDTHSPLRNPNIVAQFYDDVENDRKGIKILDLDFEAIHRQLGRINILKEYTAEYLGQYDKMFDDDATQHGNGNPQTRTLPPPVFSTGCNRSSTGNRCADIVKQHCIFDKNNLESLLTQGASTGKWVQTPALLSLYSENNLDRSFREIHMCRRTENVDLFGHSNPSADSFVDSEHPPEGGRCSMADLKVPVHGAGKDFLRGPVSTKPAFTLMNPRSIPDPDRCHLAEDESPPELLMAPQLDLSDGNHPRYVGEYYMTAPTTEDPAPVRAAQKLCHRIDSNCISPEKGMLFGRAGKHAVDMKYETLNRNAHTQANGRMWEKSPALLPEYPMHRGMYKQNLQISEVFQTSTTDIWTDKVTQNPSTECRVGKLTWFDGLKVTPFVLNSAALGNDVSFSHVIYNDRVRWMASRRVGYPEVDV